MRCPLNGGSYYFNYNGFHSVVLLALVDAAYTFLYIDMGVNGTCSGAGIFKNCGLYKALNEGTASPLPHDDQALPYFIAGDDAFGLTTWLR